MRLFPVFLAGCTLHTPFSGPGWDGALSTDAEGPFVAVVTHTRPVKEHRDAFDDHVDAITAQLEDQPGFVGGSLRGRLVGREVWTLTVWEDEESIADFVTSGAHWEALQDVEVIEGIGTVEWAIEPSELPPSWSDALDRLDAVEANPPW